MPKGEPTGAGSGDPQQEPLTPERDQEISDLYANMKETFDNRNPWGPQQLFEAFAKRGITKEETELWNNQSGRNTWVVRQYEGLEKYREKKPE